jgi:hypothetical protein
MVVVVIGVVGSKQSKFKWGWGRGICWVWTYFIGSDKSLYDLEGGEGGGGGGTCATKLSCKKIALPLSSLGDKWIDSKAQKSIKASKSSLEILEGKEGRGPLHEFQPMIHHSIFCMSVLFLDDEFLESPKS